MLIRLFVAAMVMFCAFDAFGAEAPVYTGKFSIICNDERPLYYLDKILKQGDSDAAAELILVYIEKGTCVAATSGLPVYIMTTDGVVATIRMKGTFVPIYTIERFLVRSQNKSQNLAPGKDLKTPEMRNF